MKGKKKASINSQNFTKITLYDTYQILHIQFTLPTQQGKEHTPRLWQIIQRDDSHTDNTGRV